MKTASHYLEVLVKETQKSESEVMAWAFQTGLRYLWRGRVLGRYLRGDISRVDAIDAVGIDWVEIAERQHEAILEDLEWALGT